MANDYIDMKAYEEYLLDLDRKQYEEDCAFEEYLKTRKTSEYRDALRRIDGSVRVGLLTPEDELYDLFIDAEFNLGVYEKDFNLIEKLVVKEEEHIAKEAKLVLESEWVCIADCYCFNGIITNGEIVKIKNVNKLRITVSTELYDETYVMYQQLLVCFKPKES